MGKRVMVLVGTKKGAFIAESDESRQNWSLRGPYCGGQVSDIKYDPATGSIFAGGVAWKGDGMGPAVWRSADLGHTWTECSTGITYGPDGPAMNKVWGIQPAHGVVYAGLDPAGLFRSTDGGETWQQVEGLQRIPSRPDWGGGAGGLGLHTIVPHPTDPRQFWVGVSAVGVWYTADAGETWEMRNGGVVNAYNPGQTFLSFCCHKVARAPGAADILYMQDHGGVYRSDDGGRNWTDIRKGLSSDFGFACAAHPRDPKTVYLVPIQDEGRFMPGGAAAVWRTRDGGDTWEALREGLPQEHAYFQVLREGLATDPLEPAGVYFGTSNGWVMASNNEGESWQPIATMLPYVTAVSTAVLEQ